MSIRFLEVLFVVQIKPIARVYGTCRYNKHLSDLEASLQLRVTEIVNLPRVRFTRFVFGGYLEYDQFVKDKASS